MGNSNAITEKHIEDLIACERYIEGSKAYHCSECTFGIADDQIIDGFDRLTICILSLDSGFTLVGTSSYLDLANFDQEKGRKAARDDAIRKLWQLEGYRLKQHRYYEELNEWAESH